MRRNVWFKSGRSNPSGNCVEVQWKTSTRSGAAGHCAEVRRDGDLIQVRDSKDHGDGPILSFTEAEWVAFIGGAKDGEFDL